MTDLNTIKERIKSLSLKTEANGASISEAQAARAMIQKLADRYNIILDISPNSHNQLKQKGPLQQRHEQNSSLIKFRDHIRNGTLGSDIQEIIWDDVAKGILSGNDYMEYLEKTHLMWELRQKTRNGIEDKNKITKEQYNLKCFNTFMEIYNRK